MVPFSEFVWWLGMALILGAYFLLLTKRGVGISRLYHGMNLLGALGVA